MDLGYRGHVNERLWVGGGSELADGAAGCLNASEAGVTRLRTALEGLGPFALGGGCVSLTPSVEVGFRQDGGDAETGAGIDVGSGLAFADTTTGLSLDVRVRTLVVSQAEGLPSGGCRCRSSGTRRATGCQHKNRTSAWKIG